LPVFAYPRCYEKFSVLVLSRLPTALTVVA